MIKMRRKVIFYKLFFLLFLNFIVIARESQSGVSRSIAVVDLSFLMKNSVVGKSLEKQSKDLLEKNRLTALRIEEALRKEKEEANNINKNLDREQYTAALNSYNEKYNNFINLSKKLKYSWEKSVTNARAEFYKFVSSILEEIKSKYGYRIVLDSRDVLLYSPENDITMDVINVMDNKTDFKIVLKYEE